MRRPKCRSGTAARSASSGRNPAATVLASAALLVDARTWITGGGVVCEQGRVQRVLRSRRAVLRARAAGARLIDLGDLLVTPGLVDAHAHLDLGALPASLPARRGFVAWIEALVLARRRLSGRMLEQGVLSGARALLATGTTAVGDIDASGTSARLAPGLGLRVVVYRELLDAGDPGRTAGALRAVGRRMRAHRRVRGGLSPHAPYTTSSGLLAGARALAHRRNLCCSIHWAETPEEGQWLEGASGPLAALLTHSPTRSGLSLLEESGLLGERTSLVHGNVPRAGEPALLARRGVTLVHCPGTHAFFDRPPFPLRRYAAAGVRLALGTDSLASNDSLDMRREMARLRASFPGLDPAEVFRMATEGGGHALSWAELGHLRPGAAADLVGWRVDRRGQAQALEELTSSSPPVGRVFVAAREVKSPLA